MGLDAYPQFGAGGPSIPDRMPTSARRVADRGSACASASRPANVGRFVWEHATSRVPDARQSLRGPGAQLILLFRVNAAGAKVRSAAFASPSAGRLEGAEVMAQVPGGHRVPTASCHAPGWVGSQAGSHEAARSRKGAL